MSAEEEHITIARILKPQGRHGEVAAEILTDFPERFRDRKSVVLSNESGVRREARLENSWFHKGRVILKFAGVDSISDAEKLNGYEVRILRSERAQLAAGAFYVGDLVGCSVWDCASRPAREVGIVEAVSYVAGSSPLLNVRTADAMAEVPFAETYLKCVDVAAKRIDLSLPEGLLEINQPMTEEEKERFKREQRDEDSV